MEAGILLLILGSPRAGTGILILILPREGGNGILIFWSPPEHPSFVAVVVHWISFPFRILLLAAAHRGTMKNFARAT